MFAYIVLSDGMVAVPEPTRGRVWHDVGMLITELRARLYPIAKDLVGALGKGTGVLRLECWGMEVEGSAGASASGGAGAKGKGKGRAVGETVGAGGSGLQGGMVRNAEGMRLMEGDVHAFDGLARLKEWMHEHEALMRDHVWLKNAPYTVDVLPVKGLAKMFDFPAMQQTA